MLNFTDATPIAALTVGELKDLIRDFVPQAPTRATSPSANLVYGIRGIEKLFGVSHKTAQYYKDHIIREAVMQNGRKIVVDADLALKLFNERRAK